MDTIGSSAPEKIDCRWGTGSELFWSPTELKVKFIGYFFSISFPFWIHSVYQICSTTLWMFTAGAHCRRSSAWQNWSGFLLRMDILLLSKSDTDKSHRREIFRQRLPDKLIPSTAVINTFLFCQVSWWTWDKEASAWIQLAFAWISSAVQNQSLTLEQDRCSEWWTSKSYSPPSSAWSGLPLAWAINSSITAERLKSENTKASRASPGRINTLFTPRRSSAAVWCLLYFWKMTERTAGAVHRQKRLGYFWFGAYLFNLHNLWNRNWQCSRHRMRVVLLATIEGLVHWLYIMHILFLSQFGAGLSNS